MIDDRTERSPTGICAADSWREWLRISNALNLREQPTVDHPLTAEAPGRLRTRRSTRPFDTTVMILTVVMVPRCRPAWQAVRDLTISGAERLFIEELARLDARAGAEAIPAPVVGHEADGGIPIDFAWPDARIAVFLDLDDSTPTTGESLSRTGWRVLANDPTPSSQR